MTQTESQQMSDYEALLASYLSGQISERQWQAHLRDEVFAAWLKRRSASPRQQRRDAR